MHSTQRYFWELTVEEWEASRERREAARLADLELSERIGRELERERIAEELANEPVAAE